MRACEKQLKILLAEYNLNQSRPVADFYAIKYKSKYGIIISPPNMAQRSQNNNQLNLINIKNEVFIFAKYQNILY